MASQAETVARSITDLSERAQALTAVAAALAQVGQHEQAETVARSITDPGWQVDALAEVGRVLVAREIRDGRNTWPQRRVPSAGGPRYWGWCCRWSRQRPECSPRCKKGSKDVMEITMHFRN